MLALLLGLLTANRRRRWCVAFGVVALVVAGALIWYGSNPRLNIILVTLDTTRADRLGVYGYQQGLTTAFDDFARRGVIFDRAIAPAPITLPSHATMLTGLYPPEHGLRVNGAGRLPSELPFLPEILQQQGYDTGAFIAAAPVLGAIFGLDRGFDHYDDDPPTPSYRPRPYAEPRRDGEEVVDLALAWLRQRTSQPFFCWIHLYDAHAPYEPRVDVYQQQFVENPYDAGVAWEIQQFERVAAFLKDSNLDSNTLVVIAGDHGEGLDEHQEVEHGMLVYDTTLHVPLVFVGPSPCRPGTRVAETVSLVDLMPTLLELLELPVPDSISGQSLLAALSAQTIESRDCYAEAETPYIMNHWSPLRAVISDHWKFIHTTRPELYDLELDPGELTNLADSAIEQRERLQSLLDSIQGSFVASTAHAAGLSDKELANLQALGYVSAGRPAGAESDSPDAEVLPDVKDFLPQLATFEEAKHISLAGRVEESIALLQEIIATTDEFPAANLLLGDCLVKAERLDEATQVYRSLLIRRPDYVRLHFSLGQILVRLGRFEDAVTQFRQYIEKVPDAAGAHFELANALTQLERFDEAVLEYRAALHDAPDLVAANFSLGQLFAMRRQPGEAVACFEQILRYDPGNADAHAHLLIVLAQMGQFREALRHGELAVSLAPNSFEARFNLGALLIAQRRYSDGISQLRAAQQLRPDDPRPGQQIQQAEAIMAAGGR